MPTYEFTCPEGHDFEKFYRSIGSAPTEVVCPVCGEVAERQISAGGGLVFKGSGFYITDYGKDGKKDQNAAATKSGDSKPVESGAASTSTREAKSGDSKSGDSKSGDSKSGDSKGGDSKGGDSKPSGGGGSKAAETVATPTPKPSTAKSSE